MKTTYDIHSLPENSPLMLAVKKLLRIKGNHQLKKFRQLDECPIDPKTVFKLFTPTTKKLYSELRNLGVNREKAIYKSFEIACLKQNFEMKAILSLSLGKRFDVTIHLEDLIK
jgi:hypothetical protein